MIQLSEQVAYIVIILLLLYISADAERTNPDECLGLDDIMYDGNHEELFLRFELMDRVDKQIEHGVREYLQTTQHLTTRHTTQPRSQS